MTLLAAYQVLPGPARRPGRLRGRLAGGRPVRPGAGEPRRHVRQHAADAGRAGAATRPSPSCWSAPGAACWTASSTPRCRSRRWSTSWACPATSAGSPVFQAMFVLQNYEMGRFTGVSDATDVTFDWTPMELRATRFDFELHAVETADGLWRQAGLQHRPVRPGHRRPDGRPLVRPAARGGADPGRRRSRRWTCAPPTSGRCWRPGTTPTPTSPPPRRCTARSRRRRRPPRTPWR